MNYVAIDATFFDRVGSLLRSSIYLFLSEDARPIHVLIVARGLLTPDYQSGRVDGDIEFE